MKQKTYETKPQKEKDPTIFHLSAYEATKLNKPYILPASKSGTYSKLEKAQKREEKKLKKELREYTQRDI